MTQALRHRLSVASRILAAMVGGYGLVSLITAVLSLSLRMAREQAVLLATMASFLLYAAIVMAVFYAHSATRAWTWLVGTAIPLVLIVWLLLPEAGA